MGTATVIMGTVGLLKKSPFPDSIVKQMAKEFHKSFQNTEVNT